MSSQSSFGQKSLWTLAGALAGAVSVLGVQLLRNRLNKPVCESKTAIPDAITSPAQIRRKSFTAIRNTPLPGAGSNEMSIDSLRAAFQRMDSNGNGVIDFEDFRKICLDVLQLDLSPKELQRVFNHIDRDKNESISLQEFVQGISTRRLWRSVIHLSEVASSSYNIPDNYDYTKTTNDNYGVKELKFYGPFADIRARLDYGYHTNYTKERQEWQDSFIQRVVERTDPQGSPWIVYTCGAMGVGKGYCMSWLSKTGVFPIENIVRIDPDYFKKVMPEWDGYVKSKLEAGSMCHRESGYIQEIAQEVAMRRDQNIWVDGSLRDGNWFSQVFRDIHRRYPQYRIAIFYITAPLEVVKKRVKLRAERTGRDVPEKMLMDSFNAPAISLHKLTPFVDFLARIDNGGTTPVLTTFETVSTTGCWNLIRSRFAKNFHSPQEFPYGMSPVYVTPARIDPGSLLIPRTDLESSMSDPSGEVYASLVEDVFKLTPDLQKIRSVMKHARMRASPWHAVNLDRNARKAARVPLNAQFFCYIFPSSELTLKDLEKLGLRFDCPQHEDSDSKEAVCERKDSMGLVSEDVIRLLVYGAFMYFDLQENVLSVNITDDRRGESSLQFGPAEGLTDLQVETLWEMGRWQPVTLPHIVAGKALYYAWIVPGEKVAGERLCTFGGFAYTFRERGKRSRSNMPSDRIFPVVSN